MRPAVDIAWAAGIIEGEGCILAKHYAHGRQVRLAVEMTDLDVLVRLAQILGDRVRVNERKPPSLNPRHRRRYILTLTGPALVGWLMTLYPLFGERRRAATRAALALWRAAPRAPYQQERRPARLVAYQGRR